MNQETEQLAQIIATAADRYRSIKPDFGPTPQDQAAAQAIAAAYVFIPRSELPSVEADPGGGVSVNNRSFLLCNPLESYRREALELLSAYEYAKRELEARATAARDKRRDELLLEFMPEAARANNLPTWDELNLTYQRAIDRIIDLEDAAKVDA